MAKGCKIGPGSKFMLEVIVIRLSCQMIPNHSVREVKPVHRGMEYEFPVSYLTK